MSDNKYYNPDSFFGFLNFFKSTPSEMYPLTMGRPNFPPININPSARQIYENLNLADLGIFTTSCALNFCYLVYFTLSNNALTPQHFLKETYKMNLFGFKSNILFITSTGILLAYINSHFRLAGITYNGNRWRNTKHENKNLRMVQDTGLVGAYKRF